MNLTNCASSVSCAAFGSDLLFHFFFFSLSLPTVSQKEHVLFAANPTTTASRHDARGSPPSNQAVNDSSSANEAAGRTRREAEAAPAVTAHLRQPVVSEH